MSATIESAARPTATTATPASVTVPASETPALRRVTVGQPIGITTAGVRAGDNVTKRADGTFVATAAGNVRLVENEVIVVPLLAIDGSTPTTLPIDFEGDVSADTALNFDAEFRCTGDLFVSGPVNSADVRAGRSLIAHGDIAGGRGGRTSVGDDLTCAAIRGGDVIVRGDIRASADVVSAQVACGGSLETSGAIVGGRVQANGGLRCKVLGSEASPITIVELADPRSHALLCVELKRELDRRCATAANIRARVTPFMAELKRLSPAQREKATELMAHAAELEESVALETTRFNEYRQRLVKQATPTLFVAERSFPNVTVRFAGRAECILNQAYVGPFTLTLIETGSEVAVELRREGDTTGKRLAGRSIAAAAVTR